MATIRLPSEFKEFLSLLGSVGVDYLLVGGYAVGLHGRPRPTGDIDIWVAVSPENATKLVEVFNRFGITGVPNELFLVPNRVTRVGNKPLCLEVLTGVAGVEFGKCFARRSVIDVDGVRVNLIDLRDLIKNKRAAGRAKDLADVEAFQSRVGKRTGPRSKTTSPKKRTKKTRK